ncbi:MAG: FCD domain-containing protein [Dehalococcoidales bacterium]|nr:FCD domain-containing protein [Dehalococcoidales bacterium]
MEHLLEWRVLKSLSESSGALGSVRLQGMLLKQGYTISQTTVSRLLNRFDYTGYTVSSGPKKGRRLTAKGQDRLKELSHILDLESQEQQILAGHRLQSVPDMLDFTLVRSAIEAQAAGLAAQRATPAQIEELSAYLAGTRELLGTGEHPMELNRLFHLKIAECSGSKLTLSLLRQLYRDRERLRMPGEIEPQNLRVSLAEHEAILAAIRARDVMGAGKAMRAHHQRQVKLLEDYLSSLAAKDPVVNLPGVANPGDGQG